MPGLREKLMEIMRDFESKSGTIASAVVTRDGLLVAHNFRADIDARKVAAMVASAFDSSSRASRELEQGKLKRLLLETEKGTIVATGVGDRLIFVTLAGREATLGMIFIFMEKAAEEIARVMG